MSGSGSNGGRSSTSNTISTGNSNGVETPASEARRGPAADLEGGFRTRSSFITSLDIAALLGSAEGQLIGAFIVSLALALSAGSREQRLAW